MGKVRGLEWVTDNRSPLYHLPKDLGLRHRD